MLKIYGRRDVPGLRKVVGIGINRIDISDQNSRQELITDIGSDYFVPLHPTLSLSINCSNSITPEL